MDIHDKIIQLLDDELSNNEKEELNRFLDDNHDLKLEKELYEKIISFIDQKGEEELRLKLMGFQEEYLRNARKKGSVLTLPQVALLTGIAASISILLWVAFPWNVNQNDLTVYDQYFEPYPSIISTRDRMPGGNFSVESAYNQSDHRSVIEHYRKLNYRSDTANFYKAMAHMSLSEMDSALVCFDEISDSSIFVNQAIWYRALVLISKSEISEAVVILGDIAKNSPRHKDAQRLLEDLAD